MKTKDEYYAQMIRNAKESTTTTAKGVLKRWEDSVLEKHLDNPHLGQIFQMIEDEGTFVNIDRGDLEAEVARRKIANLVH